MPCKDKRMNNPDEENRMMRSMDRMYHSSESFLYRYRWWIVLILAILLGYYLCTKRCETTGTLAASETPVAVTQPSEPLAVTGGMNVSRFNSLNIASPAVNFPTEGRNLFRL